MIEANNKMFMITFGMFILIVVIGFLATMFFAPTVDTELTSLDFKNGKIKVKLQMMRADTDKQYYYNVQKGGKTIQKVIIGADFGDDVTTDKNATHAFVKGSSHEIHFTIEEDSEEFSLFSVKQMLRKPNVGRDCFDLDPDNTNWFGGPELMYQYWPIQRQVHSDYDYLPKELWSSAIMERYWLTSRGLFVYVDKEVPLFLDQNNFMKNHICFVGRKALPYWTYDDQFSYSYRIGVGKDARAAHMEAVDRILGKPSALPDTLMARYPIWSTWVRYGRPINSTTVQDFADEVVAHGFPKSNMDIDDFWEVCYGAMTLNSNFSDMRGLTNSLKGMGFRPTMWVHPFINKNCEPWYSEAMSKGFLVRSVSNDYSTSWWNSGKDEATHVDFSIPEARQWFKERLQLLQTVHGIVNFKFDAGETSWLPSDPIVNGLKELSPSSFTIDFVRFAAEFGAEIEIRTGWLTQDLPHWVRMLDLDSRWSWNNGLPTLVPTLLQMSMAGYPFVLPDMIGGNNYGNDEITKELFIRWVQATVFMPAMQFSFTPWDFDAETITISKWCTDMHEAYTDYIVERFRLVVRTGELVNPPIWWLDPDDADAQAVDDEFLLGDKILSAPVVIQGAVTRDIYLPIGKWRDGHTGELHEGRKHIKDYPAPLNILPYFIRED